MDKEKRDEIIEVRENLHDAIIKDEGRFEQKITILSSGTIVLVMTFISTLKGVMLCSCFLYVGLFITGSALIMNMVMYLVGKNWMRELIKGFGKNLDDNIYPDQSPDDQIVLLNSRIDKRNAWNLGIMIIGIILLTIFVFLNI